MRRKVHMRAAGVGAYPETPLCTPNGATLCDVTDDPKLVTCAHCRVRVFADAAPPLRPRHKQMVPKGY